MERISFEELLAAAHLVWGDKATAEKIAVNTYSILNHVEKRKKIFYCGRKARALVGGLFYLMGYKYDNVKKQTELADKLGTSDVTIRASYRKWLVDFPDLFVDVLGKMVQDGNLKYFVLMDLRQSMKST